MSVAVAALGKCFLAVSAFIRFVPGVNTQMYGFVAELSKGLATRSTTKGHGMRVLAFVHRQSVLPRKSHSAMTNKCKCVFVHMFMSPQVLMFRKRFTTSFAFVFFSSCMAFFVNFPL